MKGLVLAEKPSLMRAIQSAYKSDSFPFVLDFAAFHGHLMRLSQPKEYNPDWEKWDLKTLPMIPGQFQYLPEDVKSVDKILAMIRSGRYDFLVNACDAGREGELIFWSFYEANRLSHDVKRLWSSTTEAKDLQAALRNLRPASDFGNLRASAKLRAEFDWLTGMNFSRAVSLKTNKKSNIGRVVTPTLKIVVDREREILSFVPQNFYTVQAVLSKGGEKFPGEVLVPPELKQVRFSDKSAAEKAAAALGKTGTVESVEQKKKTFPAPTLYSTLELEKDASRRFKFRASKTDALAQELYEAGFISYPRTECRFLPTSLVPSIPSLLKPLEALPELAAALKLVTPAAIKAATTGKKYVDDSKLTDHHAIIPTTSAPKSLTADQQKLYLLIARRFVSIFLPPYVTSSMTVLIKSNGQTVKAAGRSVVDRGYSILYPDKTKEMLLPTVKKGDVVDVIGTKIHTGTTKPPDRYTDETLLDAMSNAGKFVSAEELRTILKESAGLGTSASRTSILEKLEKTGMCIVEKGVFRPSEFGMALIDAIGNRDICSPALTAKWEERLQDLEKNGHPETFKAAMLDFIRAETLDLVGNITANLGAYRYQVVGKCPICGKSVVATDNYFRCENYKADTDPCRFIVSRKETMGAVVTEKDIRLLLEGKQTEVKKLMTRDGRAYEAALVINAEGRVTPAFVDSKDPSGRIDRSKTKLIKGVAKCPLCKDGRVYRSKNYYLCTNRDNGCRFCINPELCSGHLTDEHIVTILNGETTKPITFTWKSGRQGPARLKGAAVDKGGGKSFDLEFVFDRR